MPQPFSNAILMSFVNLLEVKLNAEKDLCHTGLPKRHARHEARVIMLLEIAVLAKSSQQLGTESCAVSGHCKVEQIS